MITYFTYKKIGEEERLCYHKPLFFFQKMGIFVDVFHVFSHDFITDMMKMLHVEHLWLKKWKCIDKIL